MECYVFPKGHLTGVGVNTDVNQAKIKITLPGEKSFDS